MIAEVAPNIFCVDHQVAEGKNAIICGERAAWAIDTGIQAAEGREMADFINAKGFPADRLIYTHGHGDHVLGSAAFLGAEVYAHSLTPTEISRLLPSLACQAESAVEELSSQIAWPTVTFSEELYLNLGNRWLRLFPTPGHSQDGISIYSENDKLLIAGDSVVTGIVPAIGEGNSLVLEASLQRLRMLAIDVMIPGHGPVVYGAENVQEWLQWIADYLQRVRKFVYQSIADGISGDEIVELASYEQFVGDRLSAEMHKMPRRHAATVQKIVQENEGR